MPSHDKDANDFFSKKSEISRSQIERGAHFTYRDGFRMGVGIFIGLLLGSTILLVLVWLLTRFIH